MADLDDIINEMMLEAAGGGWQPEQEEGRNHVWCDVPPGTYPWELGDLIQEGIVALLDGAAQVGYVMDLDTLRIEFARDGAVLVIGAARVEGASQ